MQHFKIVNHQAESPGTPFPWFRPLTDAEVRRVEAVVASCVGVERTDVGRPWRSHVLNQGNVLAHYSDMTPEVFHNAMATISSDLPRFVIVGHADNTMDIISTDDMITHISSIVYPSEDVDIIDIYGRWAMFIMHYGIIYAVRQCQVSDPQGTLVELPSR